MHSSDDILCIFNVLQLIIGVFGNVVLLYMYSFNFLTSQRIRPIDVIFINLALSHILMILFRGIPLAIQVCIQKFFMSDIECKITIYIQTFSRSLSLCSTSLLSIFQAIAISSNSIKWVELKARVPKCVFPSCIFIWLFNMLLDSFVLLMVNGVRNNTVSTLGNSLGFCSIDWHALSDSKVIIWKTFYNSVFLGIMAIASGYMVLVLYRHHCHVQYFVNTIASAGARATKIILLLTVVYVSFYSVASILFIIMENSKRRDKWLIYSSALLTSAYSTISPFILISSDSQVLNCWNVFKRTKEKHTCPN